MRVSLETGERQILLARLGLPETTSDTDLAAAAATRLLAETPTPPAPAPTPDPVAGPPAPEPTPDPSPPPTPESAPDSDSVVVLDIAAHQGLVRRATLAERIQEEQRVTERDVLIEGAIRVGKFPPSRREHYRARFDSDAEACQRDIDRMATNVVPMIERGVDATEEDLEAASDTYPQEWLHAGRPQPPSTTPSGPPQSRVHGEE